MKKPPSLWFVPSEDALHPETRQTVLSIGVAYSVGAFEAICAETGIDYAKGTLCTLECARAWRRMEQIRVFRMLKTEE